jgi:hypothetical protein
VLVSSRSASAAAMAHPFTLVSCAKKLQLWVEELSTLDINLRVTLESYF